MTIKVAINGFGRIGRMVLRAHYEGGKKHGLQFVAINDLGDAQTNAHLLKYDTAHARFPGSVRSNASCTTNCLATLVKALDDRIGMVSGLMNTVHSYTNDQVLTDVYHKDLRRARSATHNMIPTKTGAAAAVGLVLPHLKGKLDGFSIRVPTINVSLVDLSFVAKRPTSVDEVNKAVKQASETDLKGLLEYTSEPLVSSDFNHHPASAILDAGLTRVAEGTLVKVCAWYDNEWGFANRMLDATVALMNAK